MRGTTCWSNASLENAPPFPRNSAPSSDRALYADVPSQIRLGIHRMPRTRSMNAYTTRSEGFTRVAFAASIVFCGPLEPISCGLSGDRLAIPTRPWEYEAHVFRAASSSHQPFTGLARSDLRDPLDPSDQYRLKNAPLSRLPVGHAHQFQGRHALALGYPLRCPRRASSYSHRFPEVEIYRLSLFLS